MTTPAPAPITRRILVGGDRWRFAMRGISLPVPRPSRSSSRAGASIRAAWLRLGVERPKLAAPPRGA